MTKGDQTTRRGQIGRRNLRAEHGVAVVEFAIVALPLFLLVFGILDFGRAMNYKNDLTSLANQAARYASVNRDPQSPSSPASFPSCATLKSYLQSQADTGELETLIGDGELRVGFDGLVDQTGAGHPVTITLDIDFPWTSLIGTEALGGIASTNVRGTATMRIEQPLTGYGGTSC
jgi:hypothetical protein